MPNSSEPDDICSGRFNTAPPFASLLVYYHKLILSLRGLKMRIDTRQPIPEFSDNIIIHGKKPRIPERYCGNCAKQYNCSILQYSITMMQTLGMSTKVPMMMMSVDSLPLPMPCEGVEWEAKKSESFENNPLVQRLGLTDVGEPYTNSNVDETAK